MLAVFVFSLAAGAQAQQALEEYLDVFTVHVKPEKRADFDAIARRIADANRRNSGDNWVTVETVYGEGNTISFISTRKSYGEVETAMGTFMNALSKAYGAAAAQKMLADGSSTMASTRSELRRRRWDLSSNVPADPAARSKMVGESRWLRTTMVRVRPGRTADFEALLKEVKAAREKASPSEVVLVSQAVAGQEGTVFYITSLKPSMADFDKMMPIQQVLGDEAYQRWLKTSADVVTATQTTISRFVPEISNAPEEIASAAPDFWTPKPAMAGSGKPAGQSKRITPAGKKTQEQ